MESYPPGMTAHHLENHDAIVRSRRRVQAVESLGSYVDGGHETERKLGRCKVVIDRLRNTYDRKAALMKLLGNAERSLSSKHDQGFNAQDVEVCQRLSYRHFFID